MLLGTLPRHRRRIQAVLVMSPYQYKGALTLAAEDSTEREMELLRMAEHRSWDAAEEARQEARRIARQNAALREQLAELRRQKKNAQTKVRRLRVKLAAKPAPAPEPVRTSLPTVFGGREGLLAAAQEVSEYGRRKRQVAA
jgi:hypothetical protein